MVSEKDRGHRAREYQRPNRKWVCGHESRGGRCPLGPSSAGKCQAGPQCLPIQVGGKWECTRTEAFGGRCQEGPKDDGSCCQIVKPCKPSLTIAARRKRVSLWMSAFVIGFLFLVVSDDTSKSLLVPGQVSASHGAFSKDCSKCHVSSLDHPTSFFPALFKLQKAERLSDSELCLNCHKLGNSAFLSHGLSPRAMQEVQSNSNIQQEINPTPLLRLSRLMRNPEKKSKEKLSCQLCHGEHKGRQHNLSEMSNEQCQFCHTAAFDRFSNGHPQFNHYPHERRTRIIFDHRTHIKKYFLEAASSERKECSDCHALDSKGNQMTSIGFDSMCSSCHLNEIRGEGQGQTGVAFFQVPEIDFETLKAKKIFVGQWPSDADGALSPFMSLLISSEPGSRAHLEVLSKLELFDLSEASEEQLQSVKYLVWSIKKLYLEIFEKGQGAIRARLQKVVNDEFSEDEVSGLLSGFPVSLFRLSISKWFPKLRETTTGLDLSSEQSILGLKKANVQTTTALFEVDSDLLEEELVDSGGWYVDGYGMFYRPRGHEDSFLKQWLLLSLEKKDTWQNLWKTLGDTNAPGRCTYCHSVEQVERQGIMKHVVNWHSQAPSNDSSFTKFKHASHLTVMKDGGCGSCHRFDPDSRYVEEYQQNDPRSFVSNFLSIDKEQCVECHTNQQAGEDCLACHNYHISEQK